MKASELHDRLGKAIYEMGDHDVFLQQFDDDMLLTLVLNELKPYATIHFIELHDGKKFFYIHTQKKLPLSSHFVLNGEHFSLKNEEM